MSDTASASELKIKISRELKTSKSEEQALCENYLSGFKNSQHSTDRDLKMCSLGLIPLHTIEDALEILLDDGQGLDLDDHEYDCLVSFTDYFIETWMEGKFPKEMWNHHRLMPILSL